MADSHAHAAQKALIRPMKARLPDEVHRASTTLELLFDLVFVVAVALAGAGLHHGIAENHFGTAILSYTMVFFAIWWAWMGFTWFASAYDVDDVPYRLLVLLQLIGALILAAGVPSVFEKGDFFITTIGYIIMRVALISQWIRAWRADPPRRPTISVYIVGLLVVQSLWAALLFMPASLKMPLFVLFAFFEIMIPILAEKKGFTPFHMAHIAERYGLFTIIVLGESILAASTAFQTALDHEELNAQVIKVAIGGVLIVFTMWWLYFKQTEHNITTSLKKAIGWGYGHFFIFSSAAAVGAGLAAMVDYHLGEAHISSLAAGMAVAVPVAIFNISLGIVHDRIQKFNKPFFVFACAMLAILATPWLADTTLWVGVISSAFLAYILWYARSAD